ncbi:MAG: hypothetical protein NT023_11080 [Armatimonadetes bacterium]|nr:hypothetical protein [Armatimonadota bacterium]
MSNCISATRLTRPVIFRYKTADKTGKPFTVRYHLLTPMPLNQMQKEHARNSSQKAEITSLKAQVTTMATENASIKAELAQQKRLLTQLAAYIQNNKNNAPAQKANFVQH